MNRWGRQYFDVFTYYLISHINLAFTCSLNQSAKQRFRLTINLAANHLHGRQSRTSIFLNQPWSFFVTVNTSMTVMYFCYFILAQTCLSIPFYLSHHFLFDLSSSPCHSFLYYMFLNMLLLSFLSISVCWHLYLSVHNYNFTAL